MVGRRRESGVSGIFSGKVSRTPSSVSAAARRNPFGMQVILLGYYNLFRKLPVDIEYSLEL